MSAPSIPSHELAGISYSDTPLIQKAISLAKERLTEAAYAHVMRSFLLGFAVADKIPLMAKRDRELHAIAAILHDLGWDAKGGFVTEDKRFEVDGANAARHFVEDGSKGWEHHRQQLLWDAIALHTTPSIAQHKEVEVQATGLGILVDIAGIGAAPPGTLTQQEWEQIAQEFPRKGFKDCLTEHMCWLCRTKPGTTYDNFVGKCILASLMFLY